MKNIHPIHHKITTSDKEALLKQKGLVVWMVGLSGSGKSTLAKALEEELYKRKHYSILLDGDNLRSGVNNNLGFSDKERLENVRRAAEIAKLYAYNGTIVICSLISPTENIRNMTRNIIGEKYFELFIHAPLEVCEERDVKGLYKKARNGEIPEFTGITSPFEEPENPDLVVSTVDNTIEEATSNILDVVLPKIRI